MSLEHRFRTLDVHQPRLDVVVDDLSPIGEVGENVGADLRRPIIAEKIIVIKTTVVVTSLDFADSRNSDRVPATLGITDRFADATNGCPETLGHIPESDVGGHGSSAPSRRINEVNERDAATDAHLLEFQQVQAAFAAFTLAYEGLRLPELRGKVHLTQTGFGANLSQKPLQDALSTRVD